MARRFGWLWPALILLMGVGYQWLVHSAVAGGQSESIRIALAFLPLLALACWVAARARNKLAWSLILLAAGSAVYALAHQGRWGLAAAYGIPHAVIYLSLSWLFGRTLWRGKEPLVTRFARRVHGTLPPALAAYTRRVTYAWCVFFAAQIVVSALLFRFAALDSWSLFVNVLNFPLLALMFIGEYVYRMIRHREFPHASLLDGIRAFANDAARSTRAKTHLHTSMLNVPLIRAYHDGAVFAYRDRRPIGVDRFLRDVAQLAALLPARRYILNLCADRYRFAVGFSAALLRRQISLLPPNHTPDLIGQLSERYSDVYCLTDAADEYRPLETVFYPALSGPDPALPSVPHIPARQIAAIVFTSGSTGQPVPNEKSWGGLVRDGAAEFDRLGMQAFPGMAVLGTVPPQHMYGLESTVLMVMQGGLALHAGRPFYPADVLAELAALPRPRCLVTTPIHLRALLAETSGLPQLDFMLCATAPLPPQLAAAAETRFAAPLFEIYGCTEAGQVATRRTTETVEWRAFPGVLLRQDKHGTWVSGGHVETEVLLHDVIELRGHSRFLLHGRTADLVNISGKRTSLASLNYHLNSIAGVSDGVFVMPEHEDGAVTRLTAFVVAPGLTSETVMNALRQRIDAAFLPRPLCLVESLPRNDTGKLPRQALCQLSTEHATKAG